MVKKRVKKSSSKFGNNIDQRHFLLIIGTFFAFISASHLIRASLQWSMNIGIFQIPVSWSWYAALMGFVFSAVAFTIAEVQQ